MPIFSKLKLFLPSALGVALVLLAFLLDAYQIEKDPEKLLIDVQEKIQSDFHQLIEENQTQSQEIILNFRKGDILPEDDHVVRLVYSKDCQLIQWSETARIPSLRWKDDLCQFPDKRVIQDQNKWYYLRHFQSETFNLVSLIPIQINYRVENLFLPPFVYLGRYRNNRDVQQQLGDFKVYYKYLEGTIKIYDEEGTFVFCTLTPNPELFHYRAKDLVLALGGLGILCLLLAFFNFCLSVRFKVKERIFSGTFIFPLSLFLLRYALYALDLPNSYRPMQFFSSSVLAINSLSPSLGDLLLNVLVVLFSIVLLLQHYQRWISRFFRWVLKIEVMAWTMQGIILAVYVVVTWWFIHFSESMVHHSTIYFGFSNIFELDLYSYTGFFILASLLVGLELILLELLRFSFHFFRGKGRLYKILLSFFFLGGLSFVFFGFKLAYFISVAVVFSLSLLVFVRTKHRLTSHLDLFNFLLIITILSLLTTVGMIEGENTRTRVEMERLADRQSDQHDLITESLFRRVTQEIETESFLLDYREKENLSLILKEKYFDSNFKGYDVRIYVYNNDTILLDRSSDFQFYQPGGAPVPLDKIGRRTMTEGLYVVPAQGGVNGNLYVGQFEVLLRSLGNILVWVELEPTQFQANRLYPQLLLDDKVRSKATLPEGFSYAVYKNKRMSRKNSYEPFTFFFSGISPIDSLQFIHQKTPNYDNLYYKVGPGKIVHVRHVRRRPFDSVNLFSFVFYFFVLAGILLMLPVWIYNLARDPGQIWRLSLKAKIQVFFLSIAILPLFVVVFFLSSYIRAHIYEDVLTEVQGETQSVLNLLRDEYLNMWSSRENYRNFESKFQHRLEEMEKTLQHDINIYNSNGTLHLTTQPSIYELGLTSRYMNPGVYQQLIRGNVSDIVIEESLGNITYFSSFYPILTAERRIAGFLNIPYYKNQDRVNEQSLSLLTLLVNIYVFVFLAIGVIAVLISNSIVRPLGMLNRQLRATSLGKRNDPIEWEAQDEIGDIIQAYNQMLQQLADSEQKLAKNEREMAWKEMARQVAHEIKNPLTPMRLSVQHLQQVWSIRKPDNEMLNKLFSRVTGTVLVQIDQLVNIANSFSQFAKMPDPKRSIFALGEVVKEVCDLYSHERVQLKMYLAEEEFYVHSDRDQLSRVFNNLIKNAMQAIEHDQGIVEVRMEIDGDQARVSVRDNGKGISKEIGNRVFEPKFSTKNSGMGLGLAMVKKIVEGSEGHIYFETEVGQGTIFFVELPRAKQA